MRGTGKVNRAAKDFRFEVVSIRPVDLDHSGLGGGRTPDGYRAAWTLYELIKLGYRLDDEPTDPSRVADSTNVVNAPNWGWYQVNARVAEKDIAAWQAQGKDQGLVRSAIRAVLKDRFRLILHEQQTTIPVYNLVVNRKGIQFKPTAPGSVLPDLYKFPDGGVSTLFSRDPTQPARFYNATIADLIAMMGHTMDRPIIGRHRANGSLRFQRVSPAGCGAWKPVPARKTRA